MTKEEIIEWLEKDLEKAKEMINNGEYSKACGWFQSSFECLIEKIKKEGRK